jgi:hypothetical protein
VSSSKKLLQTLVDEPTFRKFKKLAKAAGNTRAGYLRHLVETHIKTSLPKISDRRPSKLCRSTNEDSR